MNHCLKSHSEVVKVEEGVTVGAMVTVGLEGVAAAMAAGCRETGEERVGEGAEGGWVRKAALGEHLGMEATWEEDQAAEGMQDTGVGGLAEE
eukprot:gene13600-16081_t